MRVNAVPRLAAETRHNAANKTQCCRDRPMSAEARPAGTYDTRTRTGSHGPLLTIQGQASDCINELLHTDDVVHQSLGDRLLHRRHSELALGVLGVKDDRSPADAYNFRGIQSALSASCPLQAGPLALSQAWAKR